MDKNNNNEKQARKPHPTKSTTATGRATKKRARANTSDDDLVATSSKAPRTSTKQAPLPSEHNKLPSATHAVEADSDASDPETTSSADEAPKTARARSKIKKLSSKKGVVDFVDPKDHESPAKITKITNVDGDFTRILLSDADRIYEPVAHGEGDTEDSQSLGPFLSIEDFLDIFDEQEIWRYFGEQYTRVDYLADSDGGNTKHEIKPRSRAKAKSTQTEDNQSTSSTKGPPPLSNIKDIFKTIASKAVTHGLTPACEPFANSGMRVVTMCSGTESPLLAMKMLQEALEEQDSPFFQVEHLASAEIEPFKQAYIQRNFRPKVLFRDVTDFKDPEAMPFTVYGGKAKQPKDVHMLIAGSSCIDYSTLNVKPKGFGEPGQSYDTLTGVAQYAETCQVPIVILENVMNAPWLDVRDYWATKGYYGIVMLLDTKQYYLPQTRQRGYMVAFNVARAKSIGLDLHKAVQKVVDIMTAMSQPATSPYSAFIFAEDDIELQLAKRALANMETGNTSGLSWDACRERYANYRASKQLGVQRPLTRWQNNGYIQFPDNGWVDWARIQRERIWDTLDIDLLAFVAERDYDMRFKSRMLDLSQNVDRAEDKHPWCVVGCITPSGMPYDTRRGGPVFGKEVLALQGIPVDNLILNRESSKQLQDLAGNAMSTTVIGAAIISAIIASQTPTGSSAIPGTLSAKSMFQVFPEHNQTALSKNHSKTARQTCDLVAEIKGSVSHTTKFRPSAGSLDELRATAAGSTQLCECDGLSDLKLESYVMCRLCGHTACTVCAGNPQHEYESLREDTMPLRHTANDFVELVSESLPPLVAFNSEDTSGFQSCVPSTESLARNPILKAGNNADDYQEAVVNALRQNLHFHEIKRGRTWRIIYESSAAHLELQLQPKGIRDVNNLFDADAIRIVWLLFVKPAPDEPSVSALRGILKHPVARMYPEITLLDGTWQLWKPSMQSVKLQVQGIGEPIPAWEQRLGLQQDMFRTLTTFPQLSISEVVEHSHPLRATSSATQTAIDRISGTYDLHQDCDAAGGSLHRKRVLQQSAQGPQTDPTFFFLDPKEIGNASGDQFVFASTCEKSPLGMSREIIADVEAGWRPNSKGSSTNTKRVVNCRIKDEWKSMYNIALGTKVSDEAFEFWSPSKLDLNTGDEDNCSAASTILVARFDAEGSQPKWKNGNKYDIDLVDKPNALTEYRWFLKHVVDYLPIGQSQILQDLGRIIATCNCAPIKPELEWRIVRKGNHDTATILPFEDSEAATMYEIALNQRPSPVIAELHRQDSDVTIVVRVNVATLVHRLLATVGENRSQTIVTWCLRKQILEFDPPKFPKIHILSNDDIKQWPINDALYIGTDDAQVKRPRRFVDRDLWDTQRQTLLWMLEQESDGTPWSEWEFEDIKIPTMNLRLEAEASSIKKVRGGILADEVGAGKTTTSLALVARGFEDVSPPVASSVCGKIPTNATLILVPTNICEQWMDEIKGCFGEGNCKVVLITSEDLSSDLVSHTISEFRSADIIVAPWNLFEDQQYWELLRKVCLAPNVPDTPGRSLRQWLDEALCDLSSTITQSGGCTDAEKFWKHRKDQKEEKRIKYGTRFEAFRKDHRESTTAERTEKFEATLQASDNTAIKSHYPTSQPQQAASVDFDFEKLDKWRRDKKHSIPPLLHMFTFKRMIVDEFTYLDSKSLLAVTKLDATYRWMLSGTPPLSTFESVSAMARLLGTKITTKNEDDGAFTFERARSKMSSERSYAEEFQEQTEVQSGAWFQRRNQKAQDFVEKFVRQNQAPKTATKGHVSHRVIVDMSPLETFLYYKCHLRLLGKSIVFKGITSKPPPHDLNNDEDLARILKQAPHAEAALLCANAFLLKLVGVQEPEHGDPPENDEYYCRRMVDSKQQIIRQLIERISARLIEGWFFWGHFRPEKEDPRTNPHFWTLLETITNGDYGDPLATCVLQGLVALGKVHPEAPRVLLSRKRKARPASTARKGKTKADAGEDQQSEDEELALFGGFDERERYSTRERKLELRARSHELNTHALELVNELRQLRFLHTITSIVAGAAAPPCSSCQATVEVGRLSILGLCGHIVCQPCLIQIQLVSDYCPTSGCRASSQDCQIPAERFLDLSSAPSSMP